MDSVLQLLRAFHDKADALCLEAATYASPYLDRVGPEGSLLRTYAAILAVGLLFWAIEGVCIVLVAPWITRAFVAGSQATKPATSDAARAKQRKAARGAAVQAVARLVGSIHNSIQVPLGLLVLVDPRFHASSSTRVHFQTPLSYAMCLLSAGYFFHDLVMCAWRINLEGPLYLMHGFACHCAFAFGLHTGFIHYHGAAFLQWEISTPFVHTRWFMYKAGWANTSLYVINGLAMVLAFFGCRIAWGYTESVVLVMDIVKERYVPGTAFPKGATIGYCIAAVVMNSLNTYWFSKMVSAAHKVVVKGKKGGEVGSHKDE